MPNLVERMAKMEASADYKTLSPAEKSVARETLKNKVKNEYKEQASASGAANMERLSGAIGPRMAGAMQSVTAGALTMGNAATFGYLPKLASMLPGAGEESQYQALVDNAQEAAPVASGVGSLVGNFVGPAGKVFKWVGLGANAAIRGVGQLGGAAKALGGGKVLGALESEFGRRFAVATLKNLATGTTAITTNEVLRNREDEAGLGQRLHDAAAMATSPTNVVLSGLVGGAQAKFARPPSAALASAVARYERITGKRVPIETLTDSASQKSWYDSIAKIPGMRDVVQKQKAEAVAGLHAVVDDIAARSGAALGGTEGTRGGAASAVKKLVGTPEKLGVVTKLRQSMEKRTTAAIGGRTRVKDDFRDVLAAGVRAMRTTRSGAEPSGLEGVFRKIEAVTHGRARVPSPAAGKIPGGYATTPSPANVGFTAMTLDDAEALRKATARLAWPSPGDVLSQRWGDRTRWEAVRFYKVLSTAMERSFPEYREMLRNGKVLRDMERALKEVQVSSIDDSTAAAFFTGKDIVKRLDVLSGNSTTQDIHSLKGWYFHKFIETLEKKDGYINPDTLNSLVRKEKSMFNSQVMEKFIPGALAEVREHAKLTAAMLGKGAGRFGPEGAETAGRLAITQLFQSPSHALMGILSPIGVKFALRSAMGGRIENAIQTLSRSGPTGITRSAVAAQQAVPDFGPLKQSMFGIQPGGHQ